MAEKKTEICAEQIKTDEKYMREAIRQAKKAWKLDETPIGCVIVHEGRIIGRGYNRRNTDKSPLPARCAREPSYSHGSREWWWAV